MSMTFTKLFSSITESSIWVMDDHSRIVWITMLAMADKHGRVWASIPGLANRARVPVESAGTAIDAFLSPDQWSRTKTDDGRRIEPIDGGWRLLNYRKYRDIRDEETRREQNAEAQARFRSKHGKPEVSPDKPTGKPNAEAEAEAESKTKTGRFAPPSSEELKFYAAKIGLPDSEASAFFNYYESNGWKVGKNPMRKWESAMINWKKNWEEKRTKYSKPSIPVAQPRCGVGHNFV